MTNKIDDSEDSRLICCLRETGMVDGEVLNEVIQVQRGHWKPFGRVAVELGFMRIVQVAKVLSHQATNPGVSFGRTARSLGFLRTMEIEQILDHQRSAIPSLAEVLISEMVLEPGEVAELMHDAFHSKGAQEHA